MDDAERAFRDALHRVDSVRIPVRTLEPAEIHRTPGLGIVAGRWLAAAAALALVAGLGIWALAGRGQPMAGIPATRPTPASQVLLTGTTWMAVELYGKPAKAAPEKVPFLEFRADSTFYGGDPCNRFDGTYRLIGDELTLSSFAKTEIGCDGAQQQLFDKALANTHRVHRDGDTIELLDQPGSVLARFRSSAAYTEPPPSDLATPTPTATAGPDTPTQGPEISPTGPIPTNAAVMVRIRNAGNVDFADVHATFPSGQKVSYGALPAGTSSGYRPVDQAYSYTYLRITTAAKSYVYQPVDYVGETPLEPGRYTYVLSLVGGEVDLRLERG